MKDSAFQSFSEEALEALDFARCQRPDGSYYGTAGQCRKGALVDPREKKEAKAKKKTEPLEMAGRELALLAEKVGEGSGDPVEFLDEIKDQHEQYGSESFVSQYQSAKTNEEKVDLAQRVVAEYNNEYILTKKVMKAQNDLDSGIQKGMESLEDDQGEQLTDRAYDVLERAGFKGVTDGEAERLAMSWVGNDSGFRSW